MQLPTIAQLAQRTPYAEKAISARWAWCLLLVLVIGVRHLYSDTAPPLGAKFGDTDDALRLVQVRDFLLHGHWYDTRLQAIGAPQALVSHWSRLIDLPIAWLISFFALFVNYLQAETLAQVVWPLLLLFGLARLMFDEAERRAGLFAGLILLGLLVLTPNAWFQFVPGRIDHHNAQILCAVAGLLLLQRAITVTGAGWWAGGVMAIGLAIGFEALPLLAASLGVACLLACFDPQARAGACHAVMALAAGLFAAYLITVHPTQWMSVTCDALSPNLLLLCGAGALAAGVLHARFRAASPWLWLTVFAASGAIGLGGYVAVNPVCAGGAFAGMDPIVKTQWLAQVIEGRTLLEYGAIKPSLVFGFLVVMAVALTVLIRQALQTRSTEHIFMAASTLLAGLYGFYYMKFMPYGSLLALVPIACWIARLPAVGDTSSFTVRISAMILVSQTWLAMMAGFAIGLFSDVEANAKQKVSLSVARCLTKTDIAALSTLPPGLVISDIDLGPFIAVSTWHRAYAGPYHRIHGSIRDVLLLQSAPLASAAEQLAKMNADYLVLCGDAQGKRNASAPPKAENFATHMRRGGTFDGLEPISIGATKGPLRVWKIRKPTP